MSSFQKLDARNIFDRLIFIDVDGTITHDGGTVIEESVLAKIRELQRSNTIYLCSNSPDKSRVRALAERANVGVIESTHKKPNKRLLSDFEIKTGTRLLVIGDKYFTDGRFAREIGAEFLKVSRLYGTDEPWHLKLLYVLDECFGLLGRFAALCRPRFALLRCRQWLKNVLVFAPIFFAGSFLDYTLFTQAAICFWLFSILASAVYIVNDVIDLELDRRHARKRLRPVASGAISIREALYIAGALIIIDGAIIFMWLPKLLPIVFAYLCLNTAYSFFFKHVAVADIMCVSAFYLLRIAAGGIATATPISPWLFLCVFFLSLFFIVSKRKGEAAADFPRKVIASYTSQTLAIMLGVAAALSIASYGIYSILGAKSPYMVYSIIPVVFAFFRMLNGIYTSNNSEFPEEFVFEDVWVRYSFLAWVAYIAAVIYLS